MKFYESIRPEYEDKAIALTGLCESCTRFVDNMQRWIALSDKYLSEEEPEYDKMYRILDSFYADLRFYEEELEKVGIK